MKRIKSLEKLLGKHKPTFLASHIVDAGSDNDDEEVIRVGGAEDDGCKPGKRGPITTNSSTLSSIDATLDEAPRDYFISRFVNSSADVATREAELAASRLLTPLGDICRHLSPLLIGASAESDTASRLHGGVSGVAISASKGGAHDDMLSRVKGSATLSDEISQVRKGPSSIVSGNLKFPSCSLEEPRHGAVESSVAKSWLLSYGREPATFLATSGFASPSKSDASHFPFTPLQHLLWGPVSSYCDLSFSLRSDDNARELRSLLALHIASHVSKARTLVSGHDQKIRESHLAIQASRLASISHKAGREPGSALLATSRAQAQDPCPTVVVPEFRDLAAKW